MNTNWQQKINDAKAAGDMKAAAEYEQARNDKINSKEYTGKQTTTNNYSQYLNGGSSGSGSSNDGLRFQGIDYTQTGGGIYGVPTINSDVKNYKQGGVTYQVGANMSRRPDLAGKIAISNGYTVFYDDNGYATKAIKGVADYTPHQDINAGNGTYNSAGAWTDNEILTDADRRKIEAIRAGIGTTYTADEANQLANQIRSGYGYTIDKQGNVTDLLAKSNVDARRQQWGLDTSSPSDAQQNFVDLWEMLNNNSMNSSNVQYDPAPQWNGSEWDNVLNALAEQLLNMNYTDWTKGDQYQALADRYGNQGKMSMQDVLGQISSRTGGLASSWAQTAANQQYNSFMSQLEDAAMEMYGVERDDLYDRANMARQYAEDDYNRYLDDYNRWSNNRDFAYNAYRDSVSDQRYEDQLAYEREQDALAQNASGTTKPNLTAAQTLTAIKSGVINDTTMSAYEYYFGEPYGGTTNTTDTGNKTGGSYNNGSLTTAQVKQLQKKLGVTADGLWGAKSKKAAGGLSADKAWEKYGDTDNTVTGNDYWLGNGTTVGGKTSFSFDEDEGIFTWNGKNYNNVESMLSDIEKANLTDSEMSTLKKKLSMYGFDLA